MSSRIEDYALIGDCHTAALVSRSGSVDWLCMPRFDSPACLAALLGTTDHGRWLICPVDEPTRIQRRYRDETLVLETEFETAGGAVSIVDFMPPRTSEPRLIRTVTGVRGEVVMRFEFVIRPDYGSIIPWVRSLDGGISAVAGPDGFHLHSDVELTGKDFKTLAEFTVSAGQSFSFELKWFPSHRTAGRRTDPVQALDRTETWWHKWSRRCRNRSQWRDAMIRSLVTLKALTYAPTGGIIAAPTTSLPEQIGGERNWDYRCCWPRDATFTLHALVESGYLAEAKAWRDWLLRAIAGTPAQLQSVYGIAGEHRITEMKLSWLPGYEGSAPVRIGNGAADQLQLDVFGEIMASMYLCRRRGIRPDENSWRVQCVLMEHLELIWMKPDDSIWEIRGSEQQFTYSKVMAWVAMDRGVKMIEEFGCSGPVERWAKLRDTIHAEICHRGFDSKLNSFVQYYGSTELDASLLMIAKVGFLPPQDPRIVGTVEAIQGRLAVDGFVPRYLTHSKIDGLPPGEGVFLLCSFWLVDNLILLNRLDEAQQLFERLLALRNDVGLLSEEYDPRAKRLLGNFPQAFSHVALINSARNLSHALTKGSSKPHRTGKIT